MPDFFLTLSHMPRAPFNEPSAVPQITTRLAASSKDGCAGSDATAPRGDAGSPQEPPRGYGKALIAMVCARKARHQKNKNSDGFVKER